MQRIDFGNLPDKSRDVFPSYYDMDCESCGILVYEDDPVGFVNGDKVCEGCWEDA